MGLKIFWTDFSKNELHNIYEYYKEIAGQKIARKLVIGITRSTQKLQNYPNIGQTEELLRGRTQEFRYFVHKNYKLIYWINHEQNRIEIADVFDTRQNPVKMNRVE